MSKIVIGLSVLVTLVAGAIPVQGAVSGLDLCRTYKGDLGVMCVAKGQRVEMYCVASWTMVQIHRQTNPGYERTITYQGYEGIEEYDNQGQHDEFQLFVADRFVVEISGDKVSMVAIRQAMGQIDLKKLADAAK